MSTITITVPTLEPSQLPSVDAWLRSVLWDRINPGQSTEVTSGQLPVDFEIHRLKARLPLTNGAMKMVQGVREVFDITDCQNATRSGAAGPDSLKEGKIVVIGRGFSFIDFKESFKRMVYS